MSTDMGQTGRGISKAKPVRGKNQAIPEFLESCVLWGCSNQILIDQFTSMLNYVFVLYFPIVVAL